MGVIWSTARHCHAVLELLWGELRVQFEEKHNCGKDKRCSIPSQPSNQHISNQETTNSGQNFVNSSSIPNNGSFKRRRTSYETTYDQSYRGGSGIVTPNCQSCSTPTRPSSQYILQPQNFETQAIPSYQIPWLPKSGEVNYVENLAQYASDSRFQELQRLSDSIGGGRFPNTGDLFGQVSWESLFQGNDDGVDYSGQDNANGNGAR